MKGTIRLGCLFFVSLLTCSCWAQVSPKRGSAYGFHSENDLTKLSEGLSWWYNWSSSPDGAVVNSFDQIGVEFVPMFWNNNFNIEEAIANIPQSVKYILAYNEPNFTVEANISPQYAAANWWRIEEVAAARGLEIVSASPAYCGGSVCMNGYTNPVNWHNDFFAACPDCQVDYIAFHNYESNVGGLLALTNNLKVYGKPIWVTEFALWDPNVAENDKINYLNQAVSAFENDPDIFRYSWFAGRSSANPSVSILAGDGQLTGLGEAYIEATYGPKFDIPGDVIQAEENYRRRGTDTQETTDNGGGENVGWTDPGTWNEYIVNVNSTGSYKFTFRIASNVSTGEFDILLDDQLVKSGVKVNSTGGWQSWSDLYVDDVVLTSGEHLLKLRYSGTGININYFEAFFQSGVPAVADFSVVNQSSCVQNEIEFINETIKKIGGETYVWDFGDGANPGTAVGEGPHIVSYETSGKKTVVLTVTNENGDDTETKEDYLSIADAPTGCLFQDRFDNDIVDFIAPMPSAFDHSESQGDWKIISQGHGEWEFFNYTLNNGIDAEPMNFSCAVHLPVLRIRAKASSNCMLNVSLMDGAGRAIDNFGETALELTTNYQEFTIDYAGHFENFYGNQGIVDSSLIEKIEMAINPAFVSYPYVGANGTYNQSFVGTIDIDWIGIGDNCDFPSRDEIGSFTLEEDGGFVMLLWTMNAETNKDYYELQRSLDGGLTFVTFGAVNSLGSSAIPVSYSFEDPNELQTTTHYRIKLVDGNGSFSYSPIRVVSPIIGMEESLFMETIIEYNGDQSLRFLSDSPLQELKVYSVLGQLLFVKPLNHAREVVVDYSELPLAKGMYVIGIDQHDMHFKLRKN